VTSPSLLRGGIFIHMSLKAKLTEFGSVESNLLVHALTVVCLCHFTDEKKVVSMRCEKDHVSGFQRCNWFRSENVREKRIRRRSDGCRIMVKARWPFSTSAICPCY